MNRSIVIASLITLAVIVGIGYRLWTGAIPAAAAAPAGESAARVVVATPVKKNLQRVTVQPGRIEAFETTPILAKLPGYIKDVHHDMGDIVDAGEPLADLSIPELKDEERQKEAMATYAIADVRLAQTAIRAAEKAVTTAEAEVRQAQAGVIRARGSHERWQSEYDRIVTLAASKSVDQKLVEETKSELMSAEAAQGEAEAKVAAAQATLAERGVAVEKAHADLDVAQAMAGNAQADLARTKSLLTYTQIRMPYQGVVVERNINRGDFVQPATGSSAQPLFVVARNDLVRVFVEVPELEAALVRDGARATLSVQALPKKKIEDVVKRTSWALGANHSLRVEVDLANADGALRPGMYARAEIVLEEHPHALALPPAAVFTVEKQAYCCCVEDGLIVRKPIVLGLRTSDDVEVISGLHGDETVVQSQANALRDGQRADVTKP